MTEPITLVIPVYNEGGNIRTALAAIDEQLRAPAESWLVYDSDEDTTLAAAAPLEGKTRVPFRFVRNRYGRGVLGAIKTGLETASTPYVVVTMADLSDPPAVIDEMVAAAARTGADIVCASRYMPGGAQIGGPRFKGFLSRTAGWILHRFAGLPVRDPTNSFKLYRKSFLNAVTIESEGGFELGIELVVKAHAMGRTVVEVPTVWRDRSAGKSNFKLWSWLPRYFRWFRYAFWHSSSGRGCPTSLSK